MRTLAACVRVGERARLVGWSAAGSFEQNLCTRAPPSPCLHTQTRQYFPPHILMRTYAPSTLCVVAALLGRMHYLSHLYVGRRLVRATSELLRECEGGAREAETHAQVTRISYARSVWCAHNM